MDVFLFFVDEEKEEIYGNTLRKLDQPRMVFWSGKFLPYPMELGGIRYFPLEAMQFIAYISRNDAIRLSTLTTKQENYKAEGK